MLEQVTDEVLGAKSLKYPAKRLVYLVMARLLRQYGQIPERKKEFPDDVILDAAQILDIKPQLWDEINFEGRTFERIKAKVKADLGFRNPSENDRKGVIAAVTKENLVIGDSADAANVAIRATFLRLKIIAPSDRIIEEMAASCIYNIEQSLFLKIKNALSKEAIQKINQLLDGKSTLEMSVLKQDPGRIGLESLQKEAEKLLFLKSIPLPLDLLKGLPRPYLVGLKRRISSEKPAEIKRHPEATRYALVAIFSFVRSHEIVDDLVDLLILIVHRIGARAEQKIIK